MLIAYAIMPIDRSYYVIIKQYLWLPINCIPNLKKKTISWKSEQTG